MLFPVKLSFLQKLAFDKYGDPVDADAFPPTKYWPSMLRPFLKSRMQERLGALDYWEWRVPENFLVTDLMGHRDDIADSLGMVRPGTWGEAVDLATGIVLFMRSSPEALKSLIDFEQSDEKRRRAESKLDVIKKIAIIGGLFAGLAGIVGLVSAVKGGEDGEVASPPAQEDAAPLEKDGGGVASLVVLAPVFAVIVLVVVVVVSRAS